MTFRRTTWQSGRRSGFTLVELLVVIGIIATLAALLLPTLNTAYRNASRARMQGDLQAIVTGLEAYRLDFGDYPRPFAWPTGGPPKPAGYNAGAYVLCRALVGPADAGDTDDIGDNQTGPGFRIKPAVGGAQQGKIWGPYIPADRFVIDTKAHVLLDRSKEPILYYPANLQADVHATAGNGYVDGTSAIGKNVGMFNFKDNNGKDGNGKAITLVMMQRMLGLDPSGSGSVAAGQSPVYAGPYILWSAGVDEKFGPADTTQAVGPGNKCDDVTNFPRNEY